MSSLAFKIRNEIKSKLNIKTNKSKKVFNFRLQNFNFLNVINTSTYTLLYLPNTLLSTPITTGLHI